MLRRFFRNVVYTLIFASLVFLGAWGNFLLKPITSPPAGIRYQLHAGTTLKVFAENLNQQGIMKHPQLFILWARLRGHASELKAGIYLIRAGTTPVGLLNQVTTGSGFLYHVFTLVPGWNFQQLRTALQHEVYLRHTIQNLSDAEIMQLLGSTTTYTEGAFFPDTYFLIEGTSDIQFLNRAYKRMQFKTQTAWLTRDKSIPFKTPEEALIAASLVEKEAYLSAERPVIAGVLVNRLQKKMLLQFDPTVVYGINQWESAHSGLYLGFVGIIRKQDLQRNTPYNTYIHKGLPPTPISFVSMDALNAVLHPVHHNYFYFVATGNGGHQFSETLSEHHLAIMMSHHHDHEFFNYHLVKGYLLKRLSQVSLFSRKKI